MDTLQDVTKNHYLGESFQWLSYVYRVGLAIYIKMVGLVWQFCHFACLGSLSSLTLCANAAVAGEHDENFCNLTMFRLF